VGDRQQEQAADRDPGGADGGGGGVRPQGLGGAGGAEAQGGEEDEDAGLGDHGVELFNNLDGASSRMAERPGG